MKTIPTLILLIIGSIIALNAFGQNQNREISIHDIQFTTDPYGESPYNGNTVEITCVITSSAQIYDLGYIYAQDEGGGPWSGIMLTGSSDLINLYRGEEVDVSGVVSENFGMTIINVTSATLTGQLKDIVITDLDPSDSTAYINNGWEKWESVLVQYKDSDGDKLYISHPKPDENNDFGDYAVSPISRIATKKLGRILAGRVTSSLFSSLYVSIVSDLVWYDNSGQMQVDPLEASTVMEMDGVIGIIAYNFSNYRLLPRNNDDFININIELEPTSLPGSPLDINEINNVTFQLYPNPATEYINLKLDSNKEADVNIYDLSGRHILYQNISGSSAQIQISELDPGTYILQVGKRNNSKNAIQFVVQP